MIQFDKTALFSLVIGFAVGTVFYLAISASSAYAAGCRSADEAVLKISKEIKKSPMIDHGRKVKVGNITAFVVEVTTPDYYGKGSTYRGLIIPIGRQKSVLAVKRTRSHFKNGRKNSKHGFVYLVYNLSAQDLLNQMGDVGREYEHRVYVFDEAMVEFACLNGFLQAVMYTNYQKTVKTGYNVELAKFQNYLTTMESNIKRLLRRPRH
ncbi:MAG: hypothetical protein OXR68_07505 [Alphaproteobacteria bacterium]|nr:hypothetical protein [Alphaproteobacteria bacterium]MDD9920449.1 hypothetical protein [Alphaproteobacteria bacterium]